LLFGLIFCAGRVPGFGYVSGVRKLGPVETATAVAVALSVLCVVVPVFVRNLRASRFVEPMDGLQHIAAQAAALGLARSVDGPYPATVGRTPAEVPHGRAVVDAPGTWDDETWRSLGFEQREAHYFSFAFQSRTQGNRVQYSAVANGDLDGDGELSVFSVAGEATAGGDAVTEPLTMHREVE
jgi:hypothetical protein